MTAQADPVNIAPCAMPCFRCDKRQMTLVCWIARKGAPHRHPEHRSTYSTMEFVRCEQCGAGEIVRHSHDCFGWDPDERGDYSDWYPLSAPDADLVEQSIRTFCPAPLDPACPCRTHEAVRSQVENLPLCPSPPRRGQAAAISEPVHATRVVREEGGLRLERACGQLHTGDIVPRGGRS